jgi:hypothetical protein
MNLYTFPTSTRLFPNTVETTNENGVVTFTIDSAAPEDQYFVTFKALNDVATTTVRIHVSSSGTGGVENLGLQITSFKDVARTKTLPPDLNRFSFPYRGEGVDHYIYAKQGGIRLRVSAGTTVQARVYNAATLTEMSLPLFTSTTATVTDQIATFTWNPNVFSTGLVVPLKQGYLVRFTVTDGGLTSTATVRVRTEIKP